MNLVWELGTKCVRNSSPQLIPFKEEKTSFFTPLSGGFSCQLLMKLITFWGLSKHENYTIDILFSTT
jgi:hypothetical protein